MTRYAFKIVYAAMCQYLAIQLSMREFVHDFPVIIIIILLPQTYSLWDVLPHPILKKWVNICIYHIL